VTAASFAVTDLSRARPFKPGRHVAPKVAMMGKDAKQLDLVV